MPYDPPLDVLGVPYGTLEIPSAGGANAPANVATRGTVLNQILQGYGSGYGVGNVSKRIKAHVVRSMEQSQKGGCDCGQMPGTPAVPQGFQAPLVQGPNPLKPFEQPQTPCSPTTDALQRSGLTPSQLADCLAPHLAGHPALHPRRSSTTRRRRASASRRKARTGRRTATTRRRSSRQRLRFVNQYGKVLTKGQVAALSPADRAGVQTQLVGPMPRRAATRRRASTRRTTTRRRTVSRRRAPAAIAAAGSYGYEILRNGACYDPATRRFVPRSYCG
jgi:hypothetical protein